MASARHAGREVGSASSSSVGLREDALHRAVHDPKFFPALEGLASAVLHQDLNGVCEPEELEEFRDELLRLGEEMVGIRQEAAKTKAAAEQVQGRYAAAALADIPDAKTLEEEIKTAQANAPVTFVRSDQRPDARLRELLSNEDDDVAVVGAGGMQTRCPMTQAVMTQPLLNRNCKHYYSPEGFAMLQRKLPLRCPICRRGFGVTDVVPDEEMGFRIAQYVREQEQLQSQQQTQMEAEATLID